MNGRPQELRLMDSVFSTNVEEKIVINNLTQQEANAIVSSARRCTEATLRAFGVITEHLAYFGSGTLQYLQEAGFKLTEIPDMRGIRLDKFKDRYMEPNKSYHIKTKGHAIAIINGIMVDTEFKGFDKRTILFCWVVE